MSDHQWSEMTLRQHLVAATMPKATKTEMRQHICAAIGRLNEGDEAEWWKQRLGGKCSADYRVRVIPDPRPGEPDPWAVVWPA